MSVASCQSVTMKITIAVLFCNIALTFGNDCETLSGYFAQQEATCLEGCYRENLNETLKGLIEIAEVH